MKVAEYIYLANGNKLYWCEICMAYTLGFRENTTGYTDISCDGCGVTLVSDIYNDKGYENDDTSN